MTRWANENTWDAAIRAASSRHGVPVALIKAIIAKESSYRPTAYRAEPAVNDASIGLMQILHATAKGEGYSGGVGEASKLSGLYDPATNIEYGTSYLASRLQSTRGDVAAAISAYNGGYRPDIGFGAKATRPMTICLARDQKTGQCVTTRNVKVGEYANQPYVDSVLNNLAYFEQELAVKPTVIPATSPPLDSARQRNAESQIGGRVSGITGRTIGTRETETPSLLLGILQWFKRLLARKP